MNRVIFVLVICSLIFSACVREEKPVTATEAITIINIIDSSIKAKRPGEFNKLFSAKLLSARIAKKQNKRVDNSLMKGITAALNNATLGQQIISGMRHKGSYELVKQYEKDNRQHLIYRLYADGSLNYHDYELGRSNGKVYIADMFIYVTGEEFSETIINLAGSLVENNMSGESDLKGLRQIKLLLSQARYKEAKEAFDALPAKLKDQRSLQITHLLICSGLDEESYSNAIDRFKELFPNEPYMFLIMIDASMLQKNYAAALEYVNKTDSVINKDPFLDYYRGLLYRIMNDQPNAVRYLEAVSASMPHFSEGIVALIEQYINDGNFEKAKKTITSYRNEEKFDQESLTFMLFNHPDFKE